MKPLLMTLISFFLGAKADHSLANSSAGIVDAFKEDIRAEASAIIFKALIGLIVAVTTIFSILELGKALLVIFNEYEYGIYFKLLTFGLVSAGGCYLLFTLFRPPPRIYVEPTASAEGLDLPGLFSQFSQGLVKGYHSGLNSQTDPNRTLQADF